MSGRKWPGDLEGAASRVDISKSAWIHSDLVLFYFGLVIFDPIVIVSGGRDLVERKVWHYLVFGI